MHDKDVLAMIDSVLQKILATLTVYNRNILHRLCMIETSCTRTSDDRNCVTATS